MNKTGRPPTYQTRLLIAFSSKHLTIFDCDYPRFFFSAGLSLRNGKAIGKGSCSAIEHILPENFVSSKYSFNNQ